MNKHMAGNALGNYDEMFFRTRVLDSRIYSAQGFLESEGTTILCLN